MIHLLGFAAALCGFILLCAAMQRHQADIFGARLAPALGRNLRYGGGVLIVAAWLIDALGLGWAVGTITALGHLTLAAGLAIALLHWRSAALKKARAPAHSKQA